MCNESSSRRSVIVEVKPSCIDLLLRELTDLTKPIKVKIDIEDSGKIYKKLSTIDGVIDWEFEDKDDSFAQGKSTETEKKFTLPRGEEGLDKKSLTATETLDKLGIPRGITESSSSNIMDETTCVREEEEDNEMDFTAEDNSNVAKMYELLNISSTSDIVDFIFATWNVIKSHPAIRYNTSLFVITTVAEYKRLQEDEINYTLGFEGATSKAIQKLLIDVFYNTPSTDEAIKEAFLDTTVRIGQRWQSLKSVKTPSELMKVLYKY